MLCDAYPDTFSAEWPVGYDASGVTVEDVSIRLLSEYGVKRCVYGHLHGQSVQRGFSGNYRGVRYDLVSCDALGFALKDVSLESAEG